MSTPYMDITEFFIKKSQALKSDTIIKSPEFSLFQGTHALEIGNNKLDSGLIDLTLEEEQFDCTRELSLKQTLWVADSILRSVFVWLDNSSLSVTVFSCRYVEELLVNYTKDVRAGLKGCKFGCTEIKSSVEYLLVHRVLRSAVLGVLHFVRLCLTLGQGGVVYEEEDMNTQTMNLDIITLVGSNEVSQELSDSIAFLQSHFPHQENQDSMLLQTVLQLLLKLIDVPYYLSAKVPRSGTVLDFSIINSLRAHAQILEQNVDYLDSLDEIPGCFSIGIQKRLDNRSPTRELLPAKTEKYLSLKLFIQDLTQILSVSSRQNARDVVNHAINFANSTHHVLARAIYPLFLIRDDRTILGEEQFHEFLLEELISFSCCDSEFLTSDNKLVLFKINDIMALVTPAYFDWLNSMNQNPCRQRQHLSRSITMFDNLQGSCEQAEMTLRDTFQVKDELEQDGEIVPALPITSWLYFMKMDIMLQVVLRGFELELYGPWEYHTMYWYANGLIEHQNALLNRVLSYNLYKIEKIKNMSKQLKKKKGDQKVRYKEKMTMKTNVQLPMLEIAVATIEKTLLKYKVIQDLCHLQIYHLEELMRSKHQFFKNPTSFPFIQSPKILYDLRMKPFSAVGVPPCPSFLDYHAEMKHLHHNHNQATPEEINRLKTSLMTNLKIIIDDINNRDPSVGYNLCSENWLDWYKQLQRSCIGIVLNMNKKIQIEEGKKPKVVTERDGFHRYFPIIKVDCC